MKNILFITIANLRRTKGQAVSLIAFIFVAALLLNLSLLLMLRVGDFFSTRSEAVYAPHYILIEDKRLYSKEKTDYLAAYPGVTELETGTVIAFMSRVLYNGGNMMIDSIFLSSETERRMNTLTLIEGDAPAAPDEICLPYVFKVGGGYGVGDEFNMTSDGGMMFSFRICGFSEEYLFGSATDQSYQIYVSDSGYNRILMQMPQKECVIQQVRLQDPRDSGKLDLEFTREFLFKGDISGEDLLCISKSWNDAEATRTMMSGVTSTMLIVFAVLIILISLLVIRFRVRNSIEEGMANFGALFAVGYTGRQLTLATITQFCLLAVVGILSGVAISYTVLPLVSWILERQTALIWRQGFDITISLISSAIIGFMVLAVTAVSARRIRTLHSLTALQQGVTTHSFKRNYIPLDRSRGGLSWLLAMKSALHDKGQIVMIFCIAAVMSFAVIVGVSVYINLGLNLDTFGKTLLGETPHAIFYVRSPEDIRQIQESINEHNDVRKVFPYQMFKMMTGERYSDNIVTDDFEVFEGTWIYDGRFPKHDNEIAIGGSVAQREGINIGGTITITQGGKTVEYLDSIKLFQGGKTTDYLVVGLIQNVYERGYVCAMTTQGVRRIQPDYILHGLYVYLHDPGKTADFINWVNGQYGGILEGSLNVNEQMAAQMDVHGAIFRVVSAVIVVVTLLIILMVLYLMLRTLMLRHKQHIGIQKALGFTPFQLMNQLALHFIPVVALGVVVGGLGGLLGANGILEALGRGVGIMAVDMPAPVGPAAAMCAGLILVVYGFAILIAWQIRGVSAYDLVNNA
jgi:putative ABC transport system permease protein